MNIKNKIKKYDHVEWEKFSFIQEDNFKEFTKESIAKLKESIIKNNFVETFKVWQNRNKIYCLDGYHRCLVLKQLKEDGYKVPQKFPAIFIECTNKDDAAKLVLIYSSSYASITDEGLKEFIKNYKLDLTAFEGGMLLPSIDIDKLKLDLNPLLAPEEKLDDVPEPPKKAISKTGDLFLLDGKHRILCGDATNKADVGALMGEEKADMVFTDIPYGINYSGGRTQTVAKKDYGKIKGDKDTDISSFVALIEKNGYKRDAFICVSPINLKPVFNTLDKYDAVIVWKKNQPGLGYQWVRRYCEFIVFISNRKKAKHEQSEFDWWEIATDPKNEYQHGAQKPVLLITRAINFSSVVQDLVADWFLGSGSTLIACQQTNRICYGMEIDPIYIDVILKRYKNLYPEAKIECLNRKFDFKKLLNTNGR